MAYTVSELLLRNLRDVFGENDPARRRAAINELYNEECVFYDPNKGAHRGRDAIDRIAGIIKATHPDYQYQPIGAPEEFRELLADPEGHLQRAARGALRAGDRVFQLERLLRFSRKFSPEWRPRYVCVERLTDVPLVAVAYLWVESLLTPPGPWARSSRTMQAAAGRSGR